MKNYYIKNQPLSLRTQWLLLLLETYVKNFPILLKKEGSESPNKGFQN